jgi:glycosyltransferase involved in cell wall biosynthesis
MVGRITEAKGHDLLLNAVGKLPLALRNRMRIVIVGVPAPGCADDQRYARRLERSAKEFGLQERILWAGYQEDLSAYYALMDVLVLPSSREALGLVILEALQRGIPVIASRTGGIPEIIHDESNGLLISPEDEDALARGLERFIADPALRHRLQAGARAGLDSRFSLQTFSPAIRGLVAQLCDSSSSARDASRFPLN